MKFFFISIMKVLALIPEYKGARFYQLNYNIENHILQSSNVPGRSDTRTLSFGYTFRDIPQVAISIDEYIYNPGLPFGWSIEVVSTTKTDFTFKASEYTGIKILRLYIIWYAFNDESIEIISFKLEQPTMVISLNTISKTKELANIGILIMSGFQYSKDPDFYAEIIDVTDTDFVVQLTDSTSCLTWVTYWAVFGHEQNMWSQGLQQIVPIIRPDYTANDYHIVLPMKWSPYNWRYPPKMFYLVSFTGFNGQSGKSQRLYIWSRESSNNRIYYRIAIWDDTVVHEARFQILIYRKLEFEQSCVSIPSLNLL